MKKKGVIYGFSVLIGIFICYFIYINNSSYIKNSTWKYGEGGHVGDYIDFKNEYLKSNYIYRNDTVIGEIVFCYGNTLIVKEIETGKKGKYIRKGSRSN